MRSTRSGTGVLELRQGKGRFRKNPIASSWNMLTAAVAFNPIAARNDKVKVTRRDHVKVTHPGLMSFSLVPNP